MLAVAAVSFSFRFGKLPEAGFLNSAQCRARRPKCCAPPPNEIGSTPRDPPRRGGAFGPAGRGHCASG
eukprot:6484561-Prymnesium_polylepis.1